MPELLRNCPEPHLLNFPKVGEPAIGYISIADLGRSLPFQPQRAFWTYFTPEEIVRGRHAHYQTQQVLIAAAGRILVTTETAAGEIQTFVLEKPTQAVYLPPQVWHTMQYSHNAVQLVFASTAYDAADYIRDMEQFRSVWGSI